MPKKVQNYCTIELISHASKVMLKILQGRLQQYENWELQVIQTGFRKGRGTGDHIANFRWITEKVRWFQKNIYFCFIDYAKAFDWVDHNKLGKFLKRWEYQTTVPTSWETCVARDMLELDMEQHTGSKLGKKYVKATYCHPAYLTYMQSMSYTVLGWMIHKLDSRLLGEISVTSDMQMTTTLMVDS